MTEEEFKLQVTKRLGEFAEAIKNQGKAIHALQADLKAHIAKTSTNVGGLHNKIDAHEKNVQDKLGNIITRNTAIDAERAHSRRIWHITGASITVVAAVAVVIVGIVQVVG